MNPRSHIRFDHHDYTRIAKRMDTQRRAEVVLDLIVAEFTSDPMSVQCFDKSIVDEAIAVVKELKETKELL